MMQQFPCNPVKRLMCLFSTVFTVTCIMKQISWSVDGAFWFVFVEHQVRDCMGLPVLVVLCC